MSTVVDATSLGRWYGQVVGLNDLTVRIDGGVTGLIGPNGAGKSTFMKLLVGEIRPSRGSITVLGRTPFANRELFREVGFCPQQDALYDHMSGLEFVETLLRLTGYPRREAQAKARRALERVQLEEHMERRVGGYSKGMRQRMRLAQAIAHDPVLLVADEPLTGLDPLVRHRVLELFRELGEAGTHVLVSSHVLHEVESLTERIVLIHRGRLLAQGSVREVRKLLSRHPRQVRIRARKPRELACHLLARSDVRAARLEEEHPDGSGRLSVETHDVEGLFRGLAETVAELRPGMQALESPDANLEAVFDYLVQ